MVRVPAKSNMVLLIGTISLFIILSEFSCVLYLNYLSEAQFFRKYSLYSQVDPRILPWKRHHYLSYYPNPNYKIGNTTHNSMGYRGKEFSLSKPTGVFRIVALGGSTIYTSRVGDNKKTFTSQLENFLNTKFGHSRVEVINAGVVRYSSWESLINLAFRVLDMDPDLVVVYHGTNDVHPRLVAPGTYAGDNSGFLKAWQDPPIPIWERSCLCRYVSRKFSFTHQVGLSSFVRKEGVPFLRTGSPSNIAQGMKWLKKNPPIYFQRNLNSMIAIAKSNNIQIMMATWAYSPFFSDYSSTPHYQRGYSENNDIVKKVGELQKVPVFDFASVMPQDPKYWADGRHVNEEGALLKAKLFAEFIHQEGLIP